MGVVPTSQLAVSTTLITELVTEAAKGFDIPVELHTLDNANNTIDARIKRVSPAMFELTCPVALKEGQRLAISHEGRRIEVVVSSNSDAGGLCRLAVKVLTDERGEVRSELRLPTDLTAVVTVAGETEQIAARIVDMSPSGMGLELEKSIQRGVKVCINLDQGLAFGEIRFSRQKTDGVHVAGFLLEEYIGKE